MSTITIEGSFKASSGVTLQCVNASACLGIPNFNGGIWRARNQLRARSIVLEGPDTLFVTLKSRLALESGGIPYLDRMIMRSRTKFFLVLWVAADSVNRVCMFSSILLRWDNLGETVVTTVLILLVGFRYVFNFRIFHI